MYETSSATAARQDAGCFMGVMARVRIWGNTELLVCGFSWLLRVIDHEAVLMDPKLFSSWVRSSSQVSGVVETWVWTADKQPVALLAKK
jgi:hypothetical protein